MSQTLNNKLTFEPQKGSKTRILFKVGVLAAKNKKLDRNQSLMTEQAKCLEYSSHYLYEEIEKTLNLNE